MTLFVKLIIVLVLTFANLSQASAEVARIKIKNSVANKEFILELDLPSDFKITPQEGPDFDFYEIQRGEKVYLAIYSGSHPDFPQLHIEGSEVSYFELCVDDGKLRRETHSKPLQQIKILSEWNQGKLVHREVLARYSLGAGWPKYIHLVTPLNLSEEELQVADRLLFSVQLKPNSLNSGLINDD